MTQNDNCRLSEILRAGTPTQVAVPSIDAIERRAARRLRLRRTALGAVVALSIPAVFGALRVASPESQHRVETVVGVPDTVAPTDSLPPAAGTSPQSTPADGTVPGLQPGGRWTTLPSPASVAYPGASPGVWTGSQVIVWTLGLDGDSLTAGAVYDPTAGRWGPISSAPLSPRYRASATWTDAGLVVWGGSDPGGQPLQDGALYDPELDRWTLLPPPPAGSAMAGASAVWTGTEVLFAGGAVAGEVVNPNIIAYSPTSGIWRRLPDSPLLLRSPSLVWVRGRLVVVGSRLDDNNATIESGVAVFGPEARWRAVDTSPFSAQSNTAVRLGGRVLVVDYLLGAWLLDPDTLQWEQMDDVPGEEQECYIQAVQLSEDSVYVDYCSQRFVYDLSQWQTVATGPTRGIPIAADRSVYYLDSSTDSASTPVFAQWSSLP
jgi:hypothetical protein